MNSLLEKNSVFQNHFIGNKASEIKKNFFLYFFVEIMFAFLLHLLIENFKPEDYCFEIIWCLMFEWIWKDLIFEWLRFCYHSKNYHNWLFNSTAFFVVYKWPLTIEDVVTEWNEIKVFEVLFSKFCRLFREVADKSRLTVKKIFQGQIRTNFSTLTAPLR